MNGPTTWLAPIRPAGGVLSRAERALRSRVVGVMEHLRFL